MEQWRYELFYKLFSWQVILYDKVSRFDIWSLFYCYLTIMIGNFGNVPIDRYDKFLFYHNKSVIPFVGQSDFINIFLRKYH